MIKLNLKHVQFISKSSVSLKYVYNKSKDDFLEETYSLPLIQMQIPSQEPCVSYLIMVYLLPFPKAKIMILVLL